MRKEKGIGGSVPGSEGIFQQSALEAIEDQGVITTEAGFLQENHCQEVQQCLSEN